MTRLPVKPVITVEQALFFCRQIVDRFTIVSLTAGEYLDTIENLASKGLAKNYVYDALIMKAASNVQADRVYSWNQNDFLKISSPELFPRIRTPLQPD